MSEIVIILLVIITAFALGHILLFLTKPKKAIQENPLLQEPIAEKEEISIQPIVLKKNPVLDKKIEMLNNRIIRLEKLAEKNQAKKDLI